MSTVAELCKSKGLNPKVVRAKLRRAIKAGALKVAHDHRSTWNATPQILTFLGISDKPARKPAKAKTAKAKKTA